MGDFAHTGQFGRSFCVLTGVANAMPGHTRCKRVRENVIGEVPPEWEILPIKGGTDDRFVF